MEVKGTGSWCVLEECVEEDLIYNNSNTMQGFIFAAPSQLSLLQKMHFISILDVKF